jgi:hypothetical protein
VLSCEDCHTVSLKAAPPSHQEDEEISRELGVTARGSLLFPSDIANFTVNYLGKNLREQRIQKNSGSTQI